MYLLVRQQKYIMYACVNHVYVCMYVCIHSFKVERKASKGRKIRYKVHAKLQHFMFPVPAVPPAGLDVDRLMASLFQ